METTIGQRAARAIRDRAGANGTSYTEEIAKLDVSWRVLHGWERLNMNPNAYYLRKMVLAGYDVISILIGGTDNVE